MVSWSLHQCIHHKGINHISETYIKNPSKCDNILTVSMLS